VFEFIVTKVLDWGRLLRTTSMTITLWQFTVMLTDKERNSEILYPLSNLDCISIPNTHLLTQSAQTLG